MDAMMGRATEKAAQNSSVQKAVGTAMMNSVLGHDGDERHLSAAAGVPAEELASIKYWSRILRGSMLIISILMLITAWYNFASSSNEVSTVMLGLYVMFFAILICCFELAFKFATVMIVQNFGFMYNPFGRACFIIFVAIMCFQLSTMGKAMFALLIAQGLLQAYVYCACPHYEAYTRKLHFYGTEDSVTSPV
jgi:hypothetical protein